MTLSHLVQNRSLQEKFISTASEDEIKSTVLEVLKFAEETIERLNRMPSEEDQMLQDMALRALFFFLNQFAEKRMKAADEVDEKDREMAIGTIKDDFELVVRFCDNPDQLKTYFFKCDAGRVFEVISMAAVSFTGGNPGIERVTENAETRRMVCFDIVMQGLNYYGTLS